MIEPDFFAEDTVAVAKRLVGQILSYRGCDGIIVETEAYRNDPASHFITRPRQGAMLAETYGCVYIYLVYGVHYCLNFTTERNGVGAVLIRAVEPLHGIASMKTRRATEDLHQLTNGPGKVVQAFDIQPEHHGEPVGKAIKLYMAESARQSVISSGPRIGISKAIDLPWRFWLTDNPFVSRLAR